MKGAVRGGRRNSRTGAGAEDMVRREASCINALLATISLACAKQVESVRDAIISKGVIEAK